MDLLALRFRADLAVLPELVANRAGLSPPSRSHTGRRRRLFAGAGALCMAAALSLAGLAAPGNATAGERVIPVSAGPSHSGARDLLFGVYDPHDTFGRVAGPQIEHVFIYWQSIDRDMLRRKMTNAAAMGRRFMMTVEPYTLAADWRTGADTLFSDILAGRFDQQIADVCGAAGAYPGTVWIRWGHEMEDPSGRYPWARKDAGGYVDAFRYFARSCRDMAPNVRMLWSPKGQTNLAGYYPGDGYVDLVGLSVWGLEAWDRKETGHARGFAEVFATKYRRVAGFGKPVVIAELGVSGSAAYRREWFSGVAALRTNPETFPELSAIVFFNDKEPYHWPGGLGSPDWRITPADYSF